VSYCAVLTLRECFLRIFDLPLEVLFASSAWRRISFAFDENVET
jgi:hypothetical protein